MRHFMRHHGDKVLDEDLVVRRVLTLRHVLRQNANMHPAHTLWLRRDPWQVGKEDGAVHEECPEGRRSQQAWPIDGRKGIACRRPPSMGGCSSYPGLAVGSYDCTVARTPKSVLDA